MKAEHSSFPAQGFECVDPHSNIKAVDWVPNLRTDFCDLMLFKDNLTVYENEQ